MISIQSSTTRPICVRSMAILAVLTILAASCSGSDESNDNAGSLIGVISGGETTVGPDATADSTLAPSEATQASAGCDSNDVCRIDVPMTEIVLEVTPSSISIDGERAWLAAPDAESVVEVDLIGGSVAQTFFVGDAATDVVAGAGSLWVVTYDFSFGSMLRVDPTSGATLATVGDFSAAPRAVAILDDAVWAVVEGFGQVARIDLLSNEVTDVLGDSNISGGNGEVAIAADGKVAWAIDESTGSVERIDPVGRSIDAVVSDLGYSAAESGEFTSTLSDGAKALAVSTEGIWVLSDTANPTDEANVVGSAALFLLDRDSADVIEQIDLAIEPAFGRPGLAIAEDAAWYIGFVDGYPIRVDLATGQQTFVSLDNARAVGVATDGFTVWFALESLFDSDSVVGVNAATAAAAAAAVDQ